MNQTFKIEILSVRTLSVEILTDGKMKVDSGQKKMHKILFSKSR